MYVIETFVCVLLLSSETKASKTVVPIFSNLHITCILGRTRIEAQQVILKIRKRILLP